MFQMRWKILLAAIVMIVLGSGRGHAQGGEGQTGLVAVGELGGVARSLVTLPDGGMLLAEGESLLHLADDGVVISRAILTHGAVQAVQVRGQRAYVLTEQGVSTVALPDLIEIAFLPGGGQALLVGDQAVYVAAHAAGVRVGALDRRGLPGLWRTLQTPSSALDVAVDAAGYTLYVALGEAGVGIYAMFPDALPQPVGSLTDIGPVGQVEVVANRLLVTGGYQVQAFDLAEPAAPRLLADYTPLHDAADVLLRQEWAYVADRDSGLRRFAIGTLRDPQFDMTPLWDGEVYALAGDDRYLFAAAGWDGIVVFDAGRLDVIEQHSQVTLPGEVTALAVMAPEDARWAVAGLGGDGLVVIDWRDIAAPQIVAHLPQEAPVRAVTLRDSLAFVGLESGMVQVYSLVQLGAPRLIAAFDTGGIPQGFAWDGTLLYVAAGDGGLVVVETIRPAEPVIVGHMPPLRPDQPIQGVTLERGKRAYLSAGDALLVLDVDVVDAPQVLAALALPVKAAAARNFIVYAAGGSAFTTVNAASSNQPELLGGYRALSQVQAIAAEGQTVWLAGSGPNVTALRLSLTAAFVEEQAVDLAGEMLSGRDVAFSASGPLLLREDGQVARVSATGVETLRSGLSASERLVTLSDGHVFAAGQGWAVLDLPQTGQPHVVASGDTAGAVFDVQASGNRLVLAQGARGVSVLRRDGGQVQHLANWVPAAGAGTSQAAAMGSGAIFVAEAGPGERGALRVLAESPPGTITTVPLPGPAHSVVTDGDRAYVGYAAGDGGGLAVVDIGAPTGGVRAVDAVPLAVQGLSIDSARGLAYGVNGSLLTVLDLTDWPEMIPLAQVTLPQAVSSLQRLDDRYLVAWGGEAALLLDLTQPALPQPVAVLPGMVQAVVGSGSTLYTGSATQGLAVVDLDSLVGLADRMRVVEPDPVESLWQSDDLLFAGGQGDLRVYNVRDPLMPSRLHVLPLGSEPVTALAGLEDRRGGYTLFFGQAGMLHSVRYNAGTDAGFSDVVLLAGDTAQLLGVTGQAVLTVGTDGVFQFTALAGPQQVAWQIRYPLAGGRVVSGGMWQDRLLVGTGRELVALEWPSGSGTPPRAAGQVQTFDSVPATIEVSANGLIWLGGDEELWLVDARDPAQLSVVNGRSVPGGVADLAVVSEQSEMIVASGACGVRVLDNVTLAEVGAWREDWPVSAVAVGSDGQVAAAGEGRFALLLRAEVDVDHLLQPIAPDPPQGGLASVASPTLRWQVQDDGCRQLQYEVWMGIGSDPLAKLGVVDSPALELQELPDRATVRWQIKVLDSVGNGVEGPVWSFTIEQAESGSPVPDASRLAAAITTPTANPFPAAPEPVAMTGPIDTQFLLPLLVGGIVLEVILVGGLWLWWRSRRRVR